VTVIAAEQQVRVLYPDRQVACDAQDSGRCAAVIELAHLPGKVGSNLIGVTCGARPSTESLAQAYASMHAGLFRGYAGIRAYSEGTGDGRRHEGQGPALGWRAT